MTEMLLHYALGKVQSDSRDYGEEKLHKLIRGETELLLKGLNSSKYL